jgi:hypothetical protein
VCTAVAAGAQVWRRVAGAAAAEASFSIWLEYLLARVWTISSAFCDALSLGRDALLLVWLSSIGFASGGILRSRLRCLDGGFDLWLGDEGIVVVKRAHHHIYSNRLWAHTPSVSLKRWNERYPLDIELVEELSLGSLARAASKSIAARVTSRSSCRNPKPLVEAP